MSTMFQFRGEEVSEAAELLQEQRLGGFNKSEVAREGTKQMLRQIATPEEKATIFGMWRRGEVEEDVARVFLGEGLDTMLEDAEAVTAALDEDTSDLVQ